MAKFRIHIPTLFDRQFCADIILFSPYTQIDFMVYRTIQIDQIA